MRQLATCVALLLLSAPRLAGTEYGPRIGAVVPDFHLTDQFGNSRSLKSLMGPRGAILLFFRSADWCAYCKSQLVELDRNREDLRRLGLGVGAISFDSFAVLRTFGERRGIAIPLLSDPDSRVIRMLNILNESIASDDPSYGVPYPCSFVLDANGVLAGKFFEDNHRRTFTFSEILRQGLGLKLAAGSFEAQGRHLKLLATASSNIITPGKHAAVTVEVELAPNMHVYASGVEDYTPVQFKMAQTTALAASQIQFPAPEQLRVPPLPATVPVYRGRFRIRGAVTFAEDPGLRSAADSTGYFCLEAVLRYQACDESTCYPPDEVRVQWKFQYAGFDRERVPAAIQRKPPVR